MSYDLMVFRKEAAPSNKSEFMNWYNKQTEWTEGHSYDDPANTSNDLRNWFMDMIKTFPPLNGPYSNENDESNYQTDYSIGKDVIYAAFSWSLAELAYKTTMKLAERHGVGFFDVSTDDGDIYFPQNGKLVPISNPDRNKTKVENGSRQLKKTWWKFW